MPPAAEENTESGGNRLARKEWVWAVGAALLTFLSRLAIADRRGFWIDEYYSLRAIMQPFEWLTVDRLIAGHSPLPFLYARWFYLNFGSEEAALRLSSVLAAGAATIAVAGLVGALGLRRLLIPTLILCILHPYWLYVGTQLRYMMPLIAVSGFAAWAAVLHAENPRRWTWSVATCLSGLALWIHGSAQFFLAGLLIYSCFRLRRRWRDKTHAFRVLSPFLFGFLISVPLLVALAETKGKSGGPALPDPSTVFRNLEEVFFGDEDIGASIFPVHDNVFGTINLVVLVIAFIALRRFLRREGLPRQRAYFLAMLIGIPAAILLVTMLARDVQGPERYVSFLSIPIILSLSIGWYEASRWKRWGVLYRVFFVVGIGLASIFNFLNQGEWHRESIHWIARQHKPGDGILAIGTITNLLAFDYLEPELKTRVDDLRGHRETEFWTRQAIIRKTRQHDLVFLLLYQDNDDISKHQILRDLREEGKVADFRRERLTDVTAVYIVATTEGAAERLAAMERMPRPFATDSPPED